MSVRSRSTSDAERQTDLELQTEAEQRRLARRRAGASAGGTSASAIAPEVDTMTPLADASGAVAVVQRPQSAEIVSEFPFLAGRLTLKKTVRCHPRLEHLLS